MKNKIKNSNSQTKTKKESKMNQSITDLQSRLSAKQEKNETDKMVLELLDKIIENEEHLCYLIPQRGNEIVFKPNDTESVFSDVAEIKRALSEKWEPTPSKPVGEYTIIIIERKYIGKSKIILQERSVDLSKIKHLKADLCKQNADDINFYRQNSLDDVVKKSCDQGAIDKADTLIKDPNTLYFLTYKKNGKDTGKFIRASHICGKELNWIRYEWSKEDGKYYSLIKEKVDVVEYRFTNNNAKRKLQLIITPVRVDLSKATGLGFITKMAILATLNGNPPLPSNFSQIFNVK